MKKILTLLLLATLTSAVGWGADVTVTKTMNEIVAENHYFVSSGNDATCYTSLDLDDNIRLSTTGAANCGSFYGTGTYDWRLYQNKGGNAIVSATEGYNLKSVTFTFSVSNTGTFLYGSNVLTSGTAVIVSGKTVTFTVGNSGTATNGQVRITAISVTYESSIKKVTGIGALSSLTSGDMVELYLPDGYNARVTHVEEIGSAVDAYVRDNTGAMRMTGISPNRPMTYNQHLAGWITGKYTVGSDGIPQFEPVEDYTNTAFLVIADRVTENETEPVEVASDEISDHLGDWVTVKDVRVGAAGSVGVTNKFNLAYYNSSQLYTGALVDIHGIAASGTAASGTLYPVDDKDEYPITHVVDAQENFVSPTESINNTQVRFKRAMSNSNYYLLTVPFEFDDFEGEVFEYKGVSLGQVGTYNYNGSQVPIMGGVMHFERYYGNLQPGTPYLVKPSSALTEMTLGGVTLSNAAAGSVKYSLAQQNTAGINLMADEQPAYVGDYTLVGSYSPQVLPKDESTAILDGNTVSWTSVAASTAIDGTEAYVTLPAGAGVKFDVPGNGIVTAISEISIDNVAPREAVIYNIMGVRMTRPLSELPPGIYIVNGKKIVKF